MKIKKVKKFFKNKKIIVLLLVLLGMAIFGFVHAQDAEVTEGLEQVGEQAGIATTEDIRVIIARIIQIIFGFLGVIAIAIVIYGGFVWMTAGGSPEKVAKAKKILVNGFIGLAIVLLAFSITTYILTTLQEAIQGEPGEYEYEEEPGVPTGPVGPGAFRIKSIQPIGDIPIRNVVVRAVFNQRLSEMDEQTLNENIVVEHVETGAEVEGTVNIDNYTLEFIPSYACPEPNQDLFCFDKNTTYQVRIRTGITNIDGDNLTCGLGSVCQATFATGELIDTEAPNVSVTQPSNYENICAEFYTLRAQVNDDSAVSTVKFYVDEQFIGADSPLDLQSSYLAQLEFETPLDEVGEHSIYATAFDIDNNSTKSISKNFIIPVAHCCNGSQDADETGIDCGGADCGACPGEACTCGVNADCASGICGPDCICVAWPTITGLSHIEGAAGNLITIFGNGFGNYDENASKVEFTADDGLVEAGVACDPTLSWTNTQVVVKVPEGTSSGPIKLTNANGDYDDTENDRGWIGDFTINPDLSWPGLCSVVSQETGLPQGQFEDLLNAQGENLGDSGDILFGQFTADISGAWSDTEITGIQVPNIQPDKVVINVRSNDTLSNPVEFTVLSSERLPEILELEPNNGGVGQYVKITGNNFGASPIPVFFINQNTDEETQADVTFPEGCTDSVWSDNEALVKVPNVELGMYYVQIKGAEVESNQVEFEVNDKPPAPGICGLDPDNGPVGTTVAVFGEYFDAGSFQFSDNVNADISNLTSTSFDTQVPALAISGPVKYIAEDGTESNTMNFTVGSCTPGSCAEKSTEFDIYECCANGVCQPEGTCEEVVTAGECEYAWMFSTGQLPLVPEVIEDQTCDDENTQSPTPWINSQDACTNALIGARFNMEMRMKIIDSKVKVERCRNQNEDCSFANCLGTENANPEAECILENIDEIYTAGRLSDFFLMDLSGEDEGVMGENMLSNMWYQVTIFGGEDRGIRGFNKKALPEDYVWKFKTQENPCEIANVLVQPARSTIDEYLATKVYSVFGQSENCNVLDVDEFDWEWELTEQSEKANIIGTENDQATVQALAETEEGEPVIIEAKTTDPETGTERSDDAELVIDFTDPRVINYGPDCDEACVNTLIWTEFNTKMNPDTMMNEADDLINVSIYECGGRQCAGLRPITEKFYGEYHESDNILKIYGKIDNSGERYYLKTNTYYRVVLNPEIMSQSGINLTGLNYDSTPNDENENIDSFSWTFRTKNDPTLCDLETVEVMPEIYESSTRGEKLIYSVIARGEPDECSPLGQLLNPYDFDWNWSSSKTNVAEITDEIFRTKFPQKTCSNRCLNLGSNQVAAICGNNIVEYGEECDDGNFENGDGCSSVCLHEPVPDIEDGGTCGDGELNENNNEECDYALEPDICTFGCQLAGSSFSGYTCGNGFIDPGEDCDDGNKANGDGCTVECLWEGSKYTAEEAAEISLCGNGEVEPGEDCDDGNILEGDGCSGRCLAEGRPENCGNDNIDIGENCDDGNTESGDGCSGECLKEGSNWFYEEPSYCGNGLPMEVGESCEAESGGQNIGAPEQLATVLGDIGNLINSDTSTIRASAINLNDERKTGEAELTFISDVCQTIPAEFETSPNGGNICRNATIEIKINQPVQQANIEDAISVSYECGVSGQNTLSLNFLDKVKNKIKLFLTKLNIFNNWFVKLKENIFHSAKAQQQNEFSGMVSKIRERDDYILFYFEDDNVQVGAVFDRNRISEELMKSAGEIQVGDEVTVSGEIVKGSVEDRKVILMANDLQMGAEQEGEGIELKGKAYDIDITDNTVSMKLELDEKAKDFFNILTANAIINKDNVSKQVWENVADMEERSEMKIYGIYFMDEQGQKLEYIEILDFVIIGKTEQKAGQTEEQKSICSLNIKDIDVVYNEQIGEYGQTTITIFPEFVLEPKTKYTVDFANIRDHCGNPLSGEESMIFSFTTGQEICLLDYVSVDPADILIPEKNQKTEYTAEARSNNKDTKLNPVPGYYNWTWDWEMNTELNDVSLDNINVPGAESLEDKRILSTGATNGEVEIMAEATVTESVFGDLLKSKQGYGQAEIFLCENTWEYEDLATNSVWRNNQFNFKTKYCRDAGDPDKDDDDLPNLRIVEAPAFENDAWAQEDPVVVKEYFLLREDDNYSPDAIALRIYTNPEGVNPGIWYDLHVPNPGQYEQLQIDCTEQGENSYCYPAVRDGRTVYVSASNYITQGAGMLGQGSFQSFYNNIYVFAYSENADRKTIDIFSQLLENLKFNTNYEDNNIVKAKIKRDTQRTHDAVFIRSLINSYENQNNRLPLLRENNTYMPGTYVNGQSISTWPSWDLVLPSLLGQSLPKDPLNIFGSACTPDNPQKYDQLTCYNSEDQIFYSDYDPSKAHVYDYKISENKTDYELRINFENSRDLLFPNICSLEGISCY